MNSRFSVILVFSIAVQAPHPGVSATVSPNRRATHSFEISYEPLLPYETLMGVNARSPPTFELIH